MPLGGKSREVTLKASRGDALERVESALAEVGRVKDVNPSQARVKGSIRYGLQKVLVKAHVAWNGESSTVSLKAQGSDVWGVAAKKALERWSDALEGGS